MKIIPDSINLKITLILIAIMLLIVGLGDLQLGDFFYLHHIPELIAFIFMGSWLKELKMKIKTVLFTVISFGLMYWIIFHFGYIGSLIAIYVLMLPLFVGYFFPILIKRANFCPRCSKSFNRYSDYLSHITDHTYEKKVKRIE